MLSKFTHTALTLLVALIVLTLTACGQQPTLTNLPPVSPTATGALQTTKSPQGSPTTPTSPAPSQTSSPIPTRILPATVILVAPSGANPQYLASLTPTLKSLAEEAKMTLDVQENLSAGAIHSGVRVVVVLAPFNGLESLCSDAPKTQFVGIGFDNLKPAANLSLVTVSASSTEQQAFLAGYIAALVTPDWRTGVLIPNDPTLTQPIKDAFYNGVRYFCGLCKPVYPPFVVYPQVFSFESADWQASADALLHQSVKTAFLAAGSAPSTQIFEYLVKGKANLIGATAPPDSVKKNWIATIVPDPTWAVRQLWTDLLTGKGSAQLTMPVTITNLDSGLLGAARLRLAQEVLDGLAKDQINPKTLREP